MFKLWLRTFKDTRMLDAVTIEDASEDTRTHKVLNSLEKGCRKMNLSIPIWLDLNIRDFKKFSRTRFTGDSFMEEVDFDYLEIRIIEED